MDIQPILQHVAESARPLITILGPTASGKTGFSIHLALELKKQGIAVEVVNADSRQLYRYLDIGTAKITREEMQGVTHHLLDVLNPDEEATAGWYQTEATNVIDAVLARGNIPMLVGGSMLYLSTIIDGLTLAPDPDPSTRQRLIDEYEKDQGQTLYARLQKLDPDTASNIHPNNFPRLIRAVEICELTNATKAEAVPLTELRTGGKNSEHNNHSNYNTLILGISRERPVLYERINKRVEQMFAQGWLTEVQNLLGRGYTANNPGMKSHGYREIIDFLLSDSQHTFDTPACHPECSESKRSGDEECIEGDRLALRLTQQNVSKAKISATQDVMVSLSNHDDMQKLQQTIAAKSRQYARRQLTWWRGDNRIQWINLNEYPNNRVSDYSNTQS